MNYDVVNHQTIITLSCVTWSNVGSVATAYFHTHSRLYCSVVNEENDKQIYTSFAIADTHTPKLYFSRRQNHSESLPKVMRCVVMAKDLRDTSLNTRYDVNNSN